MAVSAKFLADFSTFDQAVERSTTKLRTFDSTIGRIDKDLSKFGNQFSGTKLIHDATLMAKAIDDIGGTSKLTERELQRVGNQAKEAVEKMAKLGLDVPQRLQDLSKHAKSAGNNLGTMASLASKVGPALAATFSIGAVVNFGREIVNTAGHFQDLNDQTGISLRRLQGLDLVLGDAGLSVDDMVAGVEQLSKRLVGGDQGAVKALERLGLSAATLQASGADEAMIKIAEAAAKIPSPMEKSALLMEILGKSGAKIGRIATEDFGKLIEAAEKSNAVLSDGVIAAADRFDDAWTRAIKSVKGSLANLLIPDAGPALAPYVAPLSASSGLPSFDADLLRRREAQAATAGLNPRDFLSRASATLTVRSKEEATKIAAAATKASEALAKFTDMLNDFTSSAARDLARFNASGVSTSFLSDMAASVRGFSLDAPYLTSRSALAGLDPRQVMFGATPVDISSLSQGRTGGRGSGSGGFFGNVVSTGKGGLSDMWAGMSGGKGTSGLLGNIGSGILTGGLNSLLNAGIGLAGKGLQKLFGGLFGGEGKKTNDLRDQTFAAAGGFDELAKRAAAAGMSIDGVLKAGKVKDFEREWKKLSETLGAFEADRQMDQERLNSAIQKYGFTLEQLGPTLQRQKLDDQAKELIEDWRVLVGAGVDMTVVNDKMAASINEYLQLARKTGTEVPSAMRPVLQKLLEQGLLTDEAGNAITDMEQAGISFADTMTEGFDKVVKKLDELIAKLGAAGSALAGLPVPTGSGLDYGQADPNDMPGFATGTRGRFLDFGRGTPVMLHGRERVITEAEGRAGASGVASLAAGLETLNGNFNRLMAVLPEQIASAVNTGRARYA